MGVYGFFSQRWVQSTRYLSASLTSLQNYMEVQRDKKITKRPCQKAKRTLELNAKRDQVQPPLPPPDRCRPCGRTATAPPGTHHLESSTVRSNMQSRRSGGAAAAESGGMADQAVKESPEESSKETNRTPEVPSPCTCFHHLESQHQQRRRDQGAMDSTSL
jgi:hypothetical protein